MLGFGDLHEYQIDMGLLETVISIVRESGMSRQG
jgi:hypothetical protein